MDINLYALEVMTKSRLAELRAAAAWYRAVESARVPRRSAWAALRSALRRIGSRSGGRKIVSPRHA